MEIDEGGQTLPLLDYLQLLWFRRKLILVITLFVGIIGYIHVNEIKKRIFGEVHAHDRLAGNAGGRYQAGDEPA